MSDHRDNPPGVSCRGFEIRGRVQGVGFRYFTRGVGRDIGLRGWVRNRPDGSVEAVAVGTADQLGSFEKALSAGPAGSRVDSVRASAADAECVSGDAFEIVY